MCTAHAIVGVKYNVTKVSKIHLLNKNGNWLKTAVEIAISPEARGL